MTHDDRVQACLEQIRRARGLERQAVGLHRESARLEEEIKTVDKSADDCLRKARNLRIQAVRLWGEDAYDDAQDRLDGHEDGGDA